MNDDIDDAEPYSSELGHRDIYNKKFSNQCDCGKVGYNKKDAATKRNEINKRGRCVRVYQCPESGLWHLTGKPKNEVSLGERGKIGNYRPSGRRKRAKLRPDSV